MQGMSGEEFRASVSRIEARTAQTTTLASDSVLSAYIWNQGFAAVPVDLLSEPYTLNPKP